MSLSYTACLAKLGAAPNVGSVGDAYDRALAKSVIGFYKTERSSPGKARGVAANLWGTRAALGSLVQPSTVALEHRIPYPPVYEAKFVVAPAGAALVAAHT